MQEEDRSTSSAPVVQRSAGEPCTEPGHGAPSAHDPRLAQHYPAEFVALFRALEARVDPGVRILDDAIAERLLSPPLRGFARAPFSIVERVLDVADPGLRTAMVCRHRFLDDALGAALADTVDPVEQVVILGAGLDSRAVRFAAALATSGGAHPLFEVDFPATQARERKQIRAAGLDPGVCVSVDCDFSRESFVDPLLRHPRFATGQKTVVLWEGVSMYLPRAAVQRTLDDVVRMSRAGSLLGMDFWFPVDGRDVRSRVRRALPHVVGMLSEPFLFSLHPEDAPAFLARHGLAVVDAADAAALSTRYVKDGRAVAESFSVVLARVAGPTA